VFITVVLVLNCRQDAIVVNEYKYQI
jgi:hypothetical protein